IWQDLVAKSRGNVRYHEGLSSAAYHHADVLLPLGRHPEARDALRRSVREGERALELSLDSPSKGWITHGYRLLGIYLRGPESQRESRRAAELLGEMAAKRGAPSESRMYVRHFQADTWKWLGLILARMQRPDEAERAFRKAIQLHEETLAELPPPTPLQNPAELLGSFTALAWFLEDRGRPEAAEPVRARARKLKDRLPQSPDSMEAGSCNEFAWALVRDRRLSVFEPAHAVRFARRAVELAPQDGNSRHTLGVALYRAGDWQAALGELTRSMEFRKGGDSVDWLFLAMAHRQLGHRDEARQWFERAAKWMDEHATRNKELLRFQELLRFRAEAEELLQINKKKD